MALAAVAGFAQPQPETGDVIYVYQKDGNILSFLRSEIVEMGYSYDDTLGVTHDEITSQVILLNDVAHIIQLDEIDSISFVTPPTVYQPGVIRIEQGLMDYVEKSDSLTIYFAANTPANLLPKVGDKLVTTEVNDKFEVGFVGVVKSVNGTTVECDPVNLGEIFITYYETNVMESQTEEPSAARRTKPIEIGHTFNLPTYTYSIGNELTQKLISSPLAYKVGTKLDFSFTPKLRVKASLIVDKEKGTILNGEADMTGLFQESLSFYGGLEDSFQFGISLFSKPVCRFVSFYFKLGVFTEQGVTATVSNVWEQQCGATFSFTFQEKAKEQLKCSFRSHEPTYSHDVVGFVDGRLAGGLFTEVGFAPNIPIIGPSLANVSLHSEFGAELVGHAMLYDNDIRNATTETRAYEILKGSNIQVNTFTIHEFQKKVLGTTITNPLASETKKVGQWNLVPNFTSITANRQNDIIEVLLDVEKSDDNLLMPVDFGVGLYNSKNEQVASDYLGNYWKGSDGGSFTNFFKELDAEEDYVVSPIVKILDFELRSSKTAETDRFDHVCPDDAHPHIINLGLPSGTLWACCNIGANTPEGFGNYYAWAETETKALFSKDTYRWKSDSPALTTGREIAGTEYDAARVNWGTPWCMPTSAQIEELIDNTTSEWTTQNGVAGRKFIGKNGGTIFLPATGLSLQGNEGVGKKGCYWSSSTDVRDINSRYYLRFESWRPELASLYCNSYYGMSVRPVRPKYVDSK